MAVGSKTPARLPKKLSVDFTGVEDRKGGKPSARVPEGDYVLQVVDAVVKKKEGADSRYINWELKTVKGAAKGKTIYHITTLKPESLWSLRNFLSALLNRDIPKKALNIDLDKYKGKMIGATIGDDDPFTNDAGKTTIKSKIVDTFPASEYSEDGSTEEDEEETDEDEAEEEVTSGDDDEELEELDTDDL